MRRSIRWSAALLILSSACGEQARDTGPGLCADPCARPHTDVDGCQLVRPGATAEEMEATCLEVCREAAHEGLEKAAARAPPDLVDERAHDQLAVGA